MDTIQKRSVLEAAIAKMQTTLKEIDARIEKEGDEKMIEELKSLKQKVLGIISESYAELNVQNNGASST